MLRDSTVAAVVVRTRPREILLATITRENQFMGYMGVGPPELRYKKRSIDDNLKCL